MLSLYVFYGLLFIVDILMTVTASIAVIVGILEPLTVVIVGAVTVGFLETVT